jgi:hypothetical protein
MNIFSFPNYCPFGFYLIAILWSIFQAIAGYHYGLYIFNSANDKGKVGMNEFWATLAYPIHHAFFYALCSLSGFIAWHIAYLIVAQITDFRNISTGTGAVLIALSLLALSGISGALPRILYLGNRPV